jgi:hypothetical protein
MLILKSVVSIVILSVVFLLLKAISEKINPYFKHFFTKCKYFVRRIYRLIKVRKRAEFVWHDLIDFSRNNGWHFGQFEKDKRIETSFQDEDGQVLKFNYRVTQNNIIFESIILPSFNEDLTTDVMILASHLNTLISFGKVRVNVKYNYVEFVFIGDLIPYMLYSGNIANDILTHHDITKDCVWAFLQLVETGDDPVFIISAFLRRKEISENEE